MRSNFYEGIYDSMLLWYKKWYPNRIQLCVITSFSMSAFLFLNLLTLMGILQLAGYASPDAMLSTRVIPVGTFVFLLCLNFYLVRRRLEKVQLLPADGGPSNTRGKALLYMGASFFGFIITMIGISLK